MKKLVFILLLMMPGLTLFAQRSEEIRLNYDSHLGKFKAESNAIRHSKNRRSYSFKFENYNSVIFTPVVKVTAKHFKTIAPDALKQYVALVDLSREPELLSPYEGLQQIKFSDSVATNISKIDAMLSEKTATRDQLHQKIDSLNKAKTNKANSLLKAVKDSLDYAQSQNKDEIIELQKEHNYWESLRNRPDPPIVRTLNKFQVEYDNLLRIEQIFNALVKELAEHKDDLGRCTSIRDNSLSELNKIYSQDGADALAFQKKFLETLNTCTALKESLALQVGQSQWSFQDQIDSAFVCSESVRAKRTILTDRVSAFSNLFPKESTTTFPKYQHKYDYALVSIKMVNNLNPKDTVLRQEIRIMTKGGIDIDFSTGLIGNNIFKNTWYVDTVGENTIRKEKVWRADLAFAALINFSYRFKADERVGLSVGPGISLFTGDARYLLGVHYYRGARDMWGVSGGLCVGKRNFLPSTVSRDGRRPMDELPSDITAVTPYEKFAAGFFVGLFYNFARL